MTQLKPKIDIMRCFRDAADGYGNHWLLLILASGLETLFQYGSLFILSGIMSGGLAALGLSVIRGDREKICLSTVFVGFQQPITFTLVALLSFLGVFLGGLFLIVPGIIAGLSFVFAYFHAYEDKKGALEALKQSVVNMFKYGFIRMSLFPLLYLLAAYISVSVVPWLSVITSWVIAPFYILAVASAYEQVIEFRNADSVEALQAEKMGASPSIQSDLPPS